uniref:3-ketoacyl-CoA thiolase 2, peroxisomal-like n=1 Tax=Hirondellea gigas TaxID=1518452 RepID=A0A6A7GAQ0_9CRUS
MERAQAIIEHLGACKKPFQSRKTAAAGRKDPDDIVIVSALRTPIGRARRGAFKDTPPLALLVPPLKAVLKETGLKPDQVDDIVVGNVRGVGLHRQAAFIAGFGDHTCIRSVNRACSSGLQAIADVAADLSKGYYDIGIAAGVESMSMDTWTPNPALVKKTRELITENQDAIDCLIPMGITSENVAEKFGVSRQEQDELAVMSHARAFAASQRDQPEIVPVVAQVIDQMSGEVKTVTVSKDEGIRSGTSLQKLLTLRPAFKQGGTTTAGNSSQVSDGGAAVVLMKRSHAAKLGIKAIGTFRSFVVKGVPPSIMGIGPAEAIPAALAKAGLTKEDIDLYEINEAFASQAVYCVKKLGLSWDNVNVNGGAIALGHPLGCTGARMTATLLHELKRRNLRYGIVSMCIGSGQGAAAVFEREY